MKYFIFSVFFTLTTSITLAQNYYEISFEGTGQNENDGGHELFIDTISNPSNTWQIGAPQKNVFTTALTIPNVIVTDMINDYPSNDTSSFLVYHARNYGHQVQFSGNYYVNSDTLTDFGLMELSPDEGNTWIDIINDPAYFSVIDWDTPEPTLSGNSNGWQFFSADLTNLWPALMTDSVLFKFTFISDGNQTNKDGLMYDSLYFFDVPPVEIIEIQTELNYLKTFPNPTSSILKIDLPIISETNSTLNIYNCLGELVLRKTENLHEIDVSKLDNGEYFIKLLDKKHLKTYSATFNKLN